MNHDRFHLLAAPARNRDADELPIITYPDDLIQLTDRAPLEGTYSGPVQLPQTLLDEPLPWWTKHAFEIMRPERSLIPWQWPKPEPRKPRTKKLYAVPFAETTFQKLPHRKVRMLDLR